MKKQIATLVVAMTLAIIGVSAPSSAAKLSAQTVFPHGVTIVVGFGSGGSVDTGARVLQPYLQRALGVPIVVQNMPGAGGIPAAHYVATLNADTPTLLMTFLPALTLGQVIGKGAYDVRKFTPVYGVYGHNTIVLIAKKGSPYKNYASLKSATQTITAAVAGVKSTGAWAALAELAEVNGIHMVPVPFKGGAAGSDAAIGGSVDLASTTLVEATRLVGSGRAQAVLQFLPGPAPELPGVESIAKVGKPSEALDLPLGLNGPPNMPPDEVRLLSAALDKVVKDPSFIQKAKNVGLQIEAQGPAVWAKTMSRSYLVINEEAPALEKFVTR